MRIDLRQSEEMCGESGAARAIAAIASAHRGERIEVLSDNADHLFAVRTWAERHGHSLREQDSRRVLIEVA
ncbi:hypothetical protein J4439_00070 [Candidatus Woesearchaeota archaeon]|nr:hypothetical protein [Candidatus Woesearchaeota archaeon]